MFSTVASAQDSKNEKQELKEAVNDLFEHMDKHEQALQNQEEETKKTQQLIVEPVIAAEEHVSLGGLKTSLPSEKSLLNARVIFVIGEPN